MITYLVSIFRCSSPPSNPVYVRHLDPPVRRDTEYPRCNQDFEESDQFRFLRDVCLVHVKEFVGLILHKTSVMRISIPLDLSTRSFIPLPPSKVSYIYISKTGSSVCNIKQFRFHFLMTSVGTSHDKFFNHVTSRSE